MTLTRRRKEFLQKIKKIYENTGIPVHYIDVAKALGVSKWTAYDILKKLENDGYLHSQYSVSREERTSGRSVLLFLPTSKAGELFPKEKEEIDYMEEWHAARKKLLEIFEKAKMHGSKKTIEDILTDMPAAGAPLVICAHIIAILIVCLQNLGVKAINTMKNLLHPAHRPELNLSLFAGTALGAAVKNMHDVINGRLADEVGRLHKYISEFSLNENRLLVKFLDEALEKAI
ncbi:MAG: Lrp/AsnC family transcriptional regulator [Pelotomaculum sp.]|nr:Lrp/AsnC family transcriptional regulator [Pelotomaculum sp.]